MTVKKIGRYLLNLAIWFLDEGANTIRGGDPHETLSSVMGKSLKAGPGARYYGISCVICRWLDKIQKDHCIKSILPGIGAEAVAPDAIAPTNVDNGA